jgi:hypothetical protein
VEAVFDLVLQTAVQNGLRQADLPAQILILSDMEFNSAVSYGFGRTLMETIAARYARYGYKLPKLVFWNIMSRTGTIPVRENELGVSLVSGFSANIMKMVMANETDPYVQLVKLLKGKRYEVIHY